MLVLSLDTARLNSQFASFGNVNMIVIANNAVGCKAQHFDQSIA